MDAIQGLTPEQQVRLRLTEMVADSFRGQTLDRVEALTKFVMTGSPAPFVIVDGHVAPLVATPRTLAELDARIAELGQSIDRGGS